MGREELGVAIPGGFYRDADHAYFDERGARVPSVTQVFSLLRLSDFSGIPEGTLEWKREYGSSLHRGVELLVQSDLDWDSCDDVLIAPLRGIEEKLKVMQYKSLAVEENRVYSLYGMRFGGTLDHRGTCIYHGEERQCVIDLKTGCKPEQYWKWQISAYTVGLEKALKPWLGIIMQVDQRGEVKTIFVDTLTGLREFQYLLAAAVLGINNGYYRIGKNGYGEAG